MSNFNNNRSDKHRYDDILDMPHHVSQKHPRMSESNRAAQFAPFAALTGYDAVIEESGRLTSGKIVLDEDERQILDNKLRYILENGNMEAKYTYFVPDSVKDGGSYDIKIGTLKKLNYHERQVIFEDGSVINIDDISDIEFV